MKKLITAIMLSTTAAAQDAVINVSSVPDTVIGVGKSNLLTLISLFFIIIFTLAFSTRYSGIGLIVTATTVWFFYFCGWLVIPPLLVILVWVIAIIHALSNRRAVT